MDWAGWVLVVARGGLDQRGGESSSSLEALEWGWEDHIKHRTCIKMSAVYKEGRVELRPNNNCATEWAGGMNE